MHARSVWLDTAIGEAIRNAQTLIAVGSAASVLGETMMIHEAAHPLSDLAIGSVRRSRLRANDEQLARTRALLGEREVLAVLGPSGILHHDGAAWRVVGGDVVTTRGEVRVEL